MSESVIKPYVSSPVVVVEDIIDWGNINVKPHSILDCVTNDIRLSISDFLKIRDKFEYVVSSNLYLSEYENHILWDCKIGQLHYYIKNLKFFNSLNLHNHKFLRLKNFLFLTNHIRYERIEIFDFLVNNNLLDKGLVNFPSISKTLESELGYALTNEQREIYLNSDNPILPLYLDMLPKETFLFEKKHDMYLNNKWQSVPDYGESYNPILYQNTYFEVVSETFYYDSVENDCEIMQLSEKTIKPIINLLPHFCLAQKDYYKLLGKFGLSFESELYKNVSKFDSLLSGKEKTLCFLDSIEYLLKMSRNDLHELYVMGYEEMIYNQQELINLFNLRRYNL